MHRPSGARVGLSRERWVIPVLICALGSSGCAGGATAPSTSSPATTTRPVGTTGGAPGTTVAPAGTTIAPGSTSTAPTSSTITTVAPTTTAGAPAWWRPVTAESPLRVWVLGDSLAETTGAALIRAASQGEWLVVHLDYVKGSGLVRPEVLDWPAGAAEGLVKRDPEVVVCLLGANDGQSLRLPGAWLPFGTLEWDAEYLRRVGGFMDLLLGGASRIYWVGAPVMAEADYDRRVRHINALQQEAAGARPAVVYLDAYALFEGPAGGYAAVLLDEHGEPVEVRLPDGVHFTAAGADRLARAILAAIAADWGLPEG